MNVDCARREENLCHDRFQEYEGVGSGGAQLDHFDVLAWTCHILEKGLVNGTAVAGI